MKVPNLAFRSALLPVACIFGVGNTGEGNSSNRKGSTNSNGAIFETTGTTTSEIYSVAGYPTDGSGPTASLLRNGKGNLYGVIVSGGTSNEGVIYELSPVKGGGWSEKVLYNFTGQSDGGAPMGTLLRDSSDNLYGTTYAGGSFGNETIYKFHP